MIDRVVVDEPDSEEWVVDFSIYKGIVLKGATQTFEIYDP